MVPKRLPVYSDRIVRDFHPVPSHFPEYLWTCSGMPTFPIPSSDHKQADICHPSSLPASGTPWKFTYHAFTDYKNPRMPQHSCCEMRVMHLHAIVLLHIFASTHWLTSFLPLSAIGYRNETALIVISLTNLGNYITSLWNFQQIFKNVPYFHFRKQRTLQILLHNYYAISISIHLSSIPPSRIIIYCSISFLSRPSASASSL